jgi:hypothetical protein
MSLAPPPRTDAAWPPPPYPPTPWARRRRWPAIAAAAGLGALVAGAITTLITIQTTNPAPTATPPSASTVTVTAGPTQPPKPAPLPAAEADKQTCRAWRTVSPLVTAAAVAQGVIPQGMTITDPAVQANPAWAAGVTKASQLYGQAADTLAAQTAAGTRPMLGQITDTTVSALHTLSTAYKTRAPESGNSMSVFQANQQAMDWLCP